MASRLGYGELAMIAACFASAGARRECFISAIRKRIKPAEEERKFEEKVDGLGKNDYICV